MLFDTRQVENRVALGMIGTGANATLKVITTAFDSSLAKLFEDRNVLLSDGGNISFNGLLTTFSQALKLEINSRIAGGAPIVISLGSATLSTSANNRMIYAVVNRTAGTATIVGDSAALPTMIAANNEVFLIAKRSDSADGTSRIYFRDGTAITSGQTTRLGTSPASSISIGQAISGSTVGSVLFVAASNLLGQDNANLYFDDTNNRLGVSAGTTLSDVLNVGSGASTGDVLARFKNNGIGSIGSFVGIEATSGDMKLGTSDVRAIKIFQNATEVARIDTAKVFHIASTTLTDTLSLGTIKFQVGSGFTPGRYLSVSDQGHLHVRIDDNSITDGIQLSNTGIAGVNQGISINARLSSVPGTPVAAGRIEWTTENSTYTGVTADSTLRFYTASDGAELEVMRMNSVGVVHIASTTLTDTLNQGGTVKFQVGSSTVASRYLSMSNSGHLHTRIDDGSVTENLMISNTGISASNQGVSLLAKLSSTAGTLQNAGNIRWISEQSTYTGGSASSSFLIFTSTGNVETERLRITSNGVIYSGQSISDSIFGMNGIQLSRGGSTPGFVANSYNTSSSSIGATIELNRARSTTVGTHTLTLNNDILGRLVFGGADGTNFEQAAAIHGLVDGSPGNNVMPGRLEFLTSPSTGATPVTRMTVKADGTVTIGVTTTPVDVTHEIRSNSGTVPTLRIRNVQNVDSVYVLECVKASSTTGTTQNFVLFSIDGGVNLSGRIAANGVGAAAFQSTSDIRLKENVRPLTSELSKIMQLNPVEFDYIENKELKIGAGHQIGFVAQDMETVYPDSVGDDENGYKHITGWSKTDARLVKAMQELNNKIDDMKSEIEFLKIQLSQ